MWYGKRMNTILVPVDFSEMTDPVVEAASALAKATGSRVVLMNSVQSPMLASESAPAIENIGEIIAVAEASAEKNLERLRTRLAKAGVPSDTRQSTGAPVANILKEAGELKAHYIVMGSHGHTAFYDLLVGSTTQGVLKKAPCPVLIVPAEKAKRRKT